jgi:hypothetical protein
MATKKKIARTKRGTKRRAGAAAKVERPIPFSPTEVPVDGEIRRAGQRAGIVPHVEDFESYASDLTKGVETLLDLMIFIGPETEGIHLFYDLLGYVRGTRLWLEGEAQRMRRVAVGGAS